MRILLEDLKFALRVMVKHPGFTLVAALSLALGIGANTAIFSIINAVVLRPLAFRDPGRLVWIWESAPKLGLPEFSVSAANYLDWRAQSRSLEDVAAMTTAGFNLTGYQEPERISGLRVSHNLPSMLGVKPLLGRVFLPEEDRPGGTFAVMISHGLWQRKFGSDASIVGRSITLDGRPASIIGVLRPGGDLSVILAPTMRFDVWAPLAPDPAGHRGSHSLYAIARLAPSATLHTAQTELDTISASLAAAYPESNAGWSTKLVPLHEVIVADTRRSMVVLFGAVGFMLLITCANVANLLLARASSRQRELAVRVSMGAGRARILRQLLTESLLLCVLSGTMGAIGAGWAVQALSRSTTLDIPRITTVSIDATALAFNLLLCVLTGAMFGVLPGFYTFSTDLAHALKDGTRGATSRRETNRFRNSMVVAEVALSVMLLIGAGLLIRSFLELMSVNPGFRPEHVASVHVDLPASKYPKESVPPFFQRVLRRLEQTRGIDSVAVGTPLPLDGGGVWQFRVAGRTYRPGEEPNANRRIVSEAYLKTLGIAVVRGRGFSVQDTAESPRVVLINQTLARRIFPGSDPIGQSILVTRTGGPYQIVGITADVKHTALDADAGSEMYFNYLQAPLTDLSMNIVFRSAGSPLAAASSVREAVWSVDKDQPVVNFRTMDQLIETALAPRRFVMTVLSVFAGLAVTLAAVGAYGVISYSVSQRTHEIGVRMALGAQPSDIRRMVVSQGVTLGIAGIGLGMIGAAALTRLMSGLLYGITPTDPFTFSSIPAILFIVVAVGSYGPARKATRVDPMIALRCD
jgi:putative ABC transport system permease protein